jgi:hypothetical protein
MATFAGVGVAAEAAGGSNSYWTVVSAGADVAAGAAGADIVIRQLWQLGKFRQLGSCGSRGSRGSWSSLGS